MQVEGNPSVTRELSEFLTRVGQCGAPYQQWCDDLKAQWNIIVSTQNNFSLKLFSYS